MDHSTAAEYGAVKLKEPLLAERQELLETENAIQILEKELKSVENQLGALHLSLQTIPTSRESFENGHWHLAPAPESQIHSGIFPTHSYSAMTSPSLMKMVSVGPSVTSVLPDDALIKA